MIGELGYTYAHLSCLHVSDGKELVTGRIWLASDDDVAGPGKSIKRFHDRLWCLAEGHAIRRSAISVGHSLFDN